MLANEQENCSGVENGVTFPYMSAKNTKDSRETFAFSGHFQPEQKERESVANQYFGLNILFLSQQHFIKLETVKTDFWSLTACQEAKGHQKLIRFLASQAFFSHAFILLSSRLLSTPLICKRLAETARRGKQKVSPHLSPSGVFMF